MAWCVFSGAKGVQKTAAKGYPLNEVIRGGHWYDLTFEDFPMAGATGIELLNYPVTGSGPGNLGGRVSYLLS